jgi:hypothetical protein
MTDISSFRSIQGSTGFVQQRESDETQFNAKGTTSFFGKIAEFFSGSQENKVIKAAFLDALTQTYGDDFRTIAEAKIKPDSGKPLWLRVLRDLKHQGDLKQLSARQPTVKFELGAGTSEEITLTGSVYKDRKQIAVGAQRFLQNNGIKGDTNILKDIETIYNDSTIVGKNPDPDIKLKQEWDFTGKYGPEGSDLLNAFLVGPKFDDVAEALKAIRAMGPSGGPNPLTTAYLRHSGLESPEGVDIIRRSSNRNALTATLASSLGSLDSCSRAFRITPPKATSRDFRRLRASWCTRRRQPWSASRSARRCCPIPSS